MDVILDKSRYINIIRFDRISTLNWHNLTRFDSQNWIVWIRIKPIIKNNKMFDIFDSQSSNRGSNSFAFKQNRHGRMQWGHRRWGSNERPSIPRRAILTNSAEFRYLHVGKVITPSTSIQNISGHFQSISRKYFKT